MNILNAESALLLVVGGGAAMGAMPLICGTGAGRGGCLLTGCSLFPLKRLQKCGVALRLVIVSTSTYRSAWGPNAIELRSRTTH